MKQILIIGLGRFGLHVAKKLNEMHTQVLGVDSSEERVKQLSPTLPMRKSETQEIRNS